MSKRISIVYIACAALYALIFPLTNVIGGGITILGIFLTFPFLILAWPGGMLAVAISGTERAYLFGASIAIFLQVLALIRLVQLLKTKSSP